MRFLITLVVAVLVSSPAFAYCFEPSVPRFFGSKPDVPREPFCINKFSNTHTCDEWEINSYNRDVESYNRDLDTYRSAVNAYVRELDNYIDEAVEYAQCEVRNL